MSRIAPTAVLRVFAILACGLTPLAGCGGDKAERYSLTGQVTYQGKPVPAGHLVFEPDASKGNQGPQGFANIENGRYATDQFGRGAVSGPLVVQITAFMDPSQRDEDEPSDEGSLTYTTHIDLPKEASSFDFDIPEQKGSQAGR
ncbi:MAG TPA: hypothetical protein DD670_05285 [Planctomycetaceae bacterium]|nr:hypothetical protein [Planctomycetaceae bacterium]